MMPATAGSSSTAVSAGQSRNRPASGRPGHAAAGLAASAPNGDGGPPPASSASAASATARGTMPSKRKAPSATKPATCRLVSLCPCAIARLPSVLDHLFEHELVLEEGGVVLGAARGPAQLRQLNHAPAVAHGGEHGRVGRLLGVTGHVLFAAGAVEQRPGPDRAVGAGAGGVQDEELLLRHVFSVTRDRASIGARPWPPPAVMVVVSFPHAMRPASMMIILMGAAAAAGCHGTQIHEGGTGGTSGVGGSVGGGS